MSYFPCDKCILLPICKLKLIEAYHSNKSLLSFFKTLKVDSTGNMIYERAAYIIYTGGMINLILGDSCEIFRKYLNREGLKPYTVVEVLNKYKITLPKILNIESNLSRNKQVSCSLYQEIPTGNII